MSSHPKPGVIFDCMIYLQAMARSTGPAAAVLRLFDADAITVFVSQDILREVRDVLTRPQVRQKNPDLTDERVEELFQRLQEKAIVVLEVPAREKTGMIPWSSASS